MTNREVAQRFDLVFDGRHLDRDRDLLCVQPVPDKRDAPPLETRVVQIDRGRDALRLVETALESKPGTVRDLMELTGLGYSTITGCLNLLRHARIVQIMGTRKTGCTTKPVTVYGLKRGAAA